MLEFVALVTFGIIAFGLLIAGLIVLPFMLIGGVLKLLVFAIALPFRLIGALFGAVAGVTGTVFGGIAALGNVRGFYFGARGGKYGGLHLARYVAREGGHLLADGVGVGADEGEHDERDAGFLVRP